MDKPRRHYAPSNKPVTKEQMLYDSTYKRHLESSNSEMESRTVTGARDGGVLEMDGGDGHKTLWTYLIALNYTLKNGFKGKIHIMYILHYNQKNLRVSVPCLEFRMTDPENPFWAAFTCVLSIWTSWISKRDGVMVAVDFSCRIFQQVRTACLCEIPVLLVSLEMNSLHINGEFY